MTGMGAAEGVVQNAHWPLIVASYAITVVGVAGMAAWIWIDGRRRKAELARLEAATARRRGEAAPERTSR